MLFCVKGRAIVQLILLGSPGAGKGTQAKFISQQLNIPQISTGDILRHEIEADTPLGQQIKAIIQAGELVSDEIINHIVLNRLKQPDCLHGFLLDGYPRTLGQAEALQEAGVIINKIIDIHVSDDEIIRRMTGRRIHPRSGRTYHVTFQPPRIDGLDDVTGEPLVQRDDDKEHTVRRRLDVYHRQTLPLKNYYRKLSNCPGGKFCYIEVNGVGSIDVVRQRVMDAIANTCRS